MSQEHYDLKPSKEAYRAIKSDVTPVSAFKELIDNALDNWRRVLDGLDRVNIEIEYYEGGPDEDDVIVIRDDSGGVEEDDVSMLFALGQSKKREITGSIGAYGIGAKKAIVNLGNQATIRSRHIHADTGFGFSIDEDWLRDDDNWTVEKVQYDDIDKGVTEVRIEDLNTPWDKYRDSLIEELGQTYQYFLRTDRLTEFEPISITVREFDKEGDQTDVTEIEPPREVDWSFTPMDGLYVRRYEDIELVSKEFDAEVTLNVTVGLMREASAEFSGADIFCQNRLVLSGVKDERAAFGTGSGSSRLGKFSGQHRRLRVIIEFETDGDASLLPWDAQKSDIDEYNRVARAAYNWVRRIVRPYYRAAGAYDDVPTTLTRPYDRDCEFSVTEALNEPYDYSERERVTDKPDDTFPDAKRIQDRARATATLGVYSPGDLPEKFEPAYREEFLRVLKNEHGVELDDDETLPTETIPAEEVPAEMTADDATSLRRDLQREARDHATREPPARRVDFDAWQQVLYDEFLREELDAVSGDEEPVEIENLETFEDDTKQTEAETEEHDADEEDDELAEEADSDTTEETGTEDESEADDETDASDVGEETEQDQLGETSSTDEAEAPSGDAITDEDDETVTKDPDAGRPERRSLDLNDEEWSELVNALGLDEDASTEEVRDRLFSTIDVLRQLPTA
jgi:hypothetical protein